jgi:CheY-like chemotaxis protein
LQNLVSNAIKYTPAGKVLLGVRRRGGALSVQVRDTGPGIPKSKRTLIFKEFHRLEETAHSVRGLGLGLAIVERIGKVLGHGIQLQSVPGRGSMFAVTLPLANAAPVIAQGTAPAPVPGRIHGLKVLCLDNEPDVLNGMRVLLEGWRCTPILAKNGPEARERLQDSEGPPDIILADYHLDSGTGLEAVASLRPLVGEQVPVIIITADPSAEVLREVRRNGYALLRKPLKAAALRALMHQLSWQRAVAAE